MDESAALTWRRVAEKHHSAMVDELSRLLDSEMQSAVARAISAERSRAVEEQERVRTESFEAARESTLRVTAESLNQVLRRLRSLPAEETILRLLAESSSPWAEQSVVVACANNQVRSVAARAVKSGWVEANVEGEFQFEANSAAAVASAIESKDPIIALVSDAELSPQLAAAFGGAEGRKAYLFPVIARQSVVAMLIACGVSASAPLELLCEAAGMRMEALRPETAPELKPLPGPELVQIAAPVVPASETSERRAWNDLSPEDQRLHLQAQRVARVRVAEMRLYHADELRKGVFSGDIYAGLQAEIDKARSEFLQSFLSKSPTMVDYLHLEILRSLAHDDDRLLGHKYPGPMV